MRVTQLHRRARRLGVFAGVALIAATPRPSPVGAHGAGIPAHQAGAVECTPGVVRAYTPRQMISWYRVNFTNAERVQWRPVLYRWTGTWRLVNNTAPWYHAFTSIYGYYQSPSFQAWQTPHGGAGVIFVPYRVSRGTYTVLNQLYWDSARYRHDIWGNSCGA